MATHRGTAGDTGAVRLTKRVVDHADSTRGRHWLWDAELKGFGVQVEASGTKTYIVRYRPKGHGRDGKRRFVKVGRHGDITAEQARDQAKMILGQVAKGQDPAAEMQAERGALVANRAKPTFEAVAREFLDKHVTLKRKAGTALNYEILLTKHTGARLKATPIDAVTRQDIAALHSALVEKPHTANRTLAVISSLYAFAAKQGLVPESFNPARGIEKYREEGRERYLTSEELQRLGMALIEAETAGIPWVIDAEHPKAKHVPKAYNGQRQLLDPYAVAAIRLLLFTGARLREILHLRWQHVDLERGLLFLPDSKTGKKTVVLNAAALDILDSLRNRPEFRSDQFVIRGLADDKPRADLNKPWRAIRRHAGLDGVRLHDLRHTFASIGAGVGVGLLVVGRLLGHSQPQTTARYAHLDADPARRAADLIGDRLTTALRGSPGAAAKLAGADRPRQPTPAWRP